MKKWIKTQWNKYVVKRTIDSSCPGSRNFVPSSSPFLPPSSRKTCRLFPLFVFSLAARGTDCALGTYSMSNLQATVALDVPTSFKPPCKSK